MQASVQALVQSAPRLATLLVQQLVQQHVDEVTVDDEAERLALACGAQISGAESTGGADLPGPVTLQLMKRLAEIAGMDYVSQAISRLGDNSSRDLAAA